MTLQQLKYITTIADLGSISKASEQLYVSQPSISSALKELETEINIKLFSRTNRGLAITLEGIEFLSYARQILEQFNLLEDKYIKKAKVKKKFGISTQHYSFVVKAFINMVENYDLDNYEFALRETKTYEVIDDVRFFRSELGIIYMNNFNKTVLSRVINDYDLQFNELFECDIYVYVAKSNPLAKQKTIEIKQLEEYPCLSFEQGVQNSLYFSEEVLSNFHYKKLIKANDRATMLNLMRGLNAYTLCSGIISEELNGLEYIAIPLNSNEKMKIGYIKNNSMELSDISKNFLKEIYELVNN